MNEPQAPDPYTTAEAQTQSNEQTAAYQTSLNDQNQITPYGSVDYTQDGTWSNGAPEMTATTSLSPELQSLVDSNISNNQAESGIEGQLASNAATSLAQPPDLTDPSALQTTMDKQNAVTMDPQWASLQDQNDQHAYDQGLAPGSEGYDNAERTFNTSRTQAYGQMYGQDQQEAQSAELAQYNEPLNALNALKSGSQVSQPGVGQTAAAPTTQVAGTNISGLIEQNYQQQLAQSNATMGGLFGLAGDAAGMFKFSDRRLKTDVTRIGTAKSGLPIYAFRYVWGGPIEIGHMADEVAAVRPDAVFSDGNFLIVDYGRL